MKTHRKKGKMSRIKLCLLLPSSWVSLGILILAIISLIFSFVLDQIESIFLSSVFSNIFAGLITGFAISLISGVKSAYCAILEAKQSWLNETHELLVDFIIAHHQLYSYKKATDDEYYRWAYDSICCASNANGRIYHEPIDRAKWFEPYEYFKKTYSYDAVEIAQILNEFHEFLTTTDNAMDNRNIILDKYKPILKTMTDLNKQILNDISSIKIKLISARKSFI